MLYTYTILVFIHISSYWMLQMNIFNLKSRKMHGYMVFLIEFGIIIAGKRKFRKYTPLFVCKISTLFLFLTVKKYFSVIIIKKHEILETFRIDVF